LGSSDYGAQLAAHLGLPYAFAYFITEGQGAEQAMELFRATYRPSERYPTPHAALCLWALAADTEDEAWRLFQSRARWRMDRNLGRLTALYPPEEAVRAYTASEQLALETLRANALVGTGPQVADKLRRLGQRLDVEELVVITWTHDPKAQRRSYELLAQEFF
jgi:luciferase family oxidoreductase group 1